MKEANGAVRQLIDRIARSEQAPELGEIVRALDRIQMLEKERLQLVCAGATFAPAQCILEQQDEGDIPFLSSCVSSFVYCM